ncbi:MAG: lamin tail domain-containing protein [Candidatus Edwardsbacteria bacterium]
MKKIMCVLGFIFLVVETQAQVVINEVCYDTPYTESRTEWIELYNKSGADITLIGWYIKDDTSTDTIPSGTTISVGGFLVLAADRDSFLLYYPTVPPAVVVDMPSNTLGNGLTNTADMLQIFNGSGTKIDQMNWGTPNPAWTNYDATLWNPACPDVIEGHSLARSPNGADTDSPSDFADASSPTPGSSNTLTGIEEPTLSPSTWGRIKALYAVPPYKRIPIQN